MTVVAEERASFDPAKKQAAQAWADFADLRDELAKLDGDPSPAEVDELDTLHATYEEKAKTVEREEEAWLHSLDAKDNGTKARKRGPVAKAIMDEISEKALVSPSGAVLSPHVLQTIVSEAQRSPSILALLASMPTTGDEVRYLAATTETLNADAVAAGAVKPTSVLTTAAVRARHHRRHRLGGARRQTTAPSVTKKNYSLELRNLA